MARLIALIPAPGLDLVLAPETSEQALLATGDIAVVIVTHCGQPMTSSAGPITPSRAITINSPSSTAHVLAAVAATVEHASHSCCAPARLHACTPHPPLLSPQLRQQTMSVSSFIHGWLAGCRCPCPARSHFPVHTPLARSQPNPSVYRALIGPVSAHPRL
jgi:hypothetical protein